MKPRDRPPHFLALDPPRVMWDQTLERPVLLIGHWLDDLHRPVLAEVMTFSSTRQPYQLRELPKLAALAKEDP